MNQLERFRAFLAREETDRPLRYAHYTGPMRERMREFLGGRDPVEAFPGDDGRYIGLRPPEGYSRPDFTGYYNDDVDPDQIDSLGVLRRKGDYFHFTHTESPLRNAASLDEIEAFPIETEEDWPEDGLADRVRDAHEQGFYVTGGVGHIYEDSWQIRGYEQFLMDLIERPEWAASIFDRITRLNIRRAEALARAGADLLHTGDDIASQKAMMFQPDLWREVLKSRWASVYAAARAVNPDVAIWYHSDGNISDVLPDLTEIGVTILNPVQPECMDLPGIRREFGDRLLFDGAIGTQSTMPWGTPDDVRRTVREMRDLFGGTLCLSPTHVLEPEVPPENVVAFFEACDAP